MAKYIFPPENFAAPYVTIGLGTLHDALVDKRLGRRQPAPPRRRIRSPFDNRMVWVRPPLDKDVLAARIWSEKQIVSDLSTGMLIVHAHNEATGQFRRIPLAFWNDGNASLSFGSLLELQEGHTFAKELAGSTIYVTGEHATAWLGGRGIGETDYFFPDELRSQPKARRASRKCRYDWTAFENQAVARLHDEGGLHENWIQANLEDEMLIWCENSWGRQPSVRSARDHVVIALSRFQAEKKTFGLGSLGS